MILDHDRPGPQGAPMLPVEIRLTPAMWEGIQRKARAMHMGSADYLRLLVEAAYAARVAPQGDAEMEAAVTAAFERHDGTMVHLAADPRRSPETDRALERLARSASAALARREG